MGLLVSRMMEYLWGNLNARIIMVGLDAAGKTTILYRLKLNENVVTIPTIGFNVETVDYKNVNFTVWDVGGQTTIRPLWRHYFQGTQGVIFVVDSVDSMRFEEAQDELSHMLSDDELGNACLLVLANKSDMPGAASATKVADALKLTAIRGRNWHVQSTSAVTGEGLYEGLDWLASAVRDMGRAGEGGSFGSSRRFY